MNWEAWKPLATLIFTSTLKFVGGLLVAHGLATNGPGLEAMGGAATTAAGALWSWWVQKGHVQAGDYLKKLTDTATQAAAIEVAKRMPISGQAQQAGKIAAQASAPAVMANDAAKTAVILLLGSAFALSFLLAGAPAMAQVPLKRPAVTGNIPADIKTDLGIGGSSGGGAATTALDNIATILAKPFQDIANFIGADADGAISLSTVIPGLQDGHGQQCWMQMKQFGDIIKAHPVPLTFHVINDFETLRLLGMATNNLCSNVHCTQVFADATAMAQAASPMPLAIPSLHDLCTKVPQIAVVAPGTAPTILTVTPSPGSSSPQ